MSFFKVVYLSVKYGMVSSNARGLDQISYTMEREIKAPFGPIFAFANLGDACRFAYSPKHEFAVLRGEGEFITGPAPYQTPEGRLVSAERMYSGFAKRFWNGLYTPDEIRLDTVPIQRLRNWHGSIVLLKTFTPLELVA